MIQLKKPYSIQRRILLKTILLLILITILSSGATIPFIFESQSLWYKFGVAKVILRTGKIAGLFAATFLFAQILLAVRLPLLDRIFGLDRVYHLHRTNGCIVVSLATLHASLVLIPEGIDNLPIGWKFWPEMVGAVVLVSLIIVTVSAQFRKEILSYHQWRNFHRPVGYLLLLAAVLHILFVSDSFEKTVPKISIVTLITIVLGCSIVTKYFYYRQTKKKWLVEEVLPLNDEVVQVLIRPLSPFSYAPGQFAFLSFRVPGKLSAPHPFTIASSPTNKELLRFIIKKRGQWTGNIEKIAREKAALQGPFGLFSYQANIKARQIVFIAAGIGITPMLSMLHHIATDNQPLQVTLIWTVRRQKDMFLQKELEQLKGEIPFFKLHLIYTRHTNGGRLNRQRLSQLIKPDPLCHIYLCGPARMMKATRHSLISLGFKGKNVFWERFSL